MSAPIPPQAGTWQVLPGTGKTEEQYRRDVCAIGSWIHARNYVAATDGNISVRLDASRILISPSAVSKGMMSPEDLVIVDPEGRLIAGSRKPSSELAMHLLVYRLRPDIHAVCHAHPPTATGYAAAGLPLNKAIASEVVLALGYIPVAPYATPGTPELTRVLEPLVPHHDALLLANHGVVTYGPDLLTAFFRLETVEHFAQVSLVTEILGKQALLTGRDVERLVAARARYGAVTAAQVAPGCPVTAESDAGERVSITRQELEALIQEAVRKDRSHR